MTSCADNVSSAGSHRASYWKTTGVGAISAAAALLSFLIVIQSDLNFLIRAGVALLIPLFLVSALVALGGIVVLCRDRRDSQNKADLFHLLINRQPSALNRVFGLIHRLATGMGADSIRPGDSVRVRSFDEILGTLDDMGQLDHLPFMPEMLGFCGGAFRVHRRIDKINDMIQLSGLRRVDNVVTLSELRCDGSAHNGCQAECQLLWHERWLVKLTESSGSTTDESKVGAGRTRDGSHDKLVTRVMQSESGSGSDGVERYVCQATELRKVSHPMSKWDIRQDIRPLLNGTVNISAFLVAKLTAAFNVAQKLRGGIGYPPMPEQLKSPPTPTAALDLRAGEPVVIRDRREIAKTLFRNHNRGMWFGKETLRFCGKTTVVRFRVNRIIDERNGEMIEMKAPCIVLDDCKATGEFLRFCPQNEHVYWREIWLRRTSIDGRDED